MISVHHTAMTREISAAIVRCELTHVAREPIDLETARRQHEAYETRLTEAGCEVVRLPASDDLPDSVFIEDTAVVFDELAIIARPGPASRRSETVVVADALAAYRSTIIAIEPPGTLDGGDVLTIGKRVFVGESQRTNAAAISQMARALTPHGYTVHIVSVRGCLHLKSAVTAIAQDAVLVNPEWVSADSLRPVAILDVHPAEPFGANALLIGDVVIYPTAFPRTAARLAARGVHLLEADVSEIAKAEGAVTCCSLVFGASRQAQD
jgi:dimethylargininase